jgi:hypothetical protein
MDFSLSRYLDKGSAQLKNNSASTVHIRPASEGQINLMTSENLRARVA